MYSLHLTHPKWTHTRSSGQPCYSARGAVGGSGSPCSRTPQSWYWRRILPPPTIPTGPEIRTHNLPLTSPTRYPLGHDCPRLPWPQPQSIPCEVSPKFLNRFCLTILIRLRFSRLVVHLFLPHFFLPLNFLLSCLDTALCEQPASLAMNVCGLPSLWRVSMIVFWTTVRSTVFPMIV